MHWGRVSVFVEDDELFHTMVPSVAVAESAVPLEITRLVPEVVAVEAITPFVMVIVVPSGLTIPNELVVAKPGVTAKDQWSLPSELAQT